MMINRFYCILLFLFIGSCCLAQDSNYRIKGSPYPFSSAPDTVFLTSESYSYSEKVSLHSLMGLLAKTKPRILRDVNNNSQMVQRAGVVVIDSFYLNYPALVRRFSAFFS